MKNQCQKEWYKYELANYFTGTNARESMYTIGDMDSNTQNEICREMFGKSVVKDRGKKYSKESSPAKQGSKESSPVKTHEKSTSRSPSKENSPTKSPSGGAGDWEGAGVRLSRSKESSPTKPSDFSQNAKDSSVIDTSVKLDSAQTEEGGEDVWQPRSGSKASSPLSGPASDAGYLGFSSAGSLGTPVSPRGQSPVSEGSGHSSRASTPSSPSSNAVSPKRGSSGAWVQLFWHFHQEIVWHHRFKLRYCEEICKC